MELLQTFKPAMKRVGERSKVKVFIRKEAGPAALNHPKLGPNVS
jgi:hypothetical protein